MSVGAFGSHTFSVSEDEIRTPDDFEFTEELDYEMQTRAGKKPATYIKGQKEMDFPMVLHLDARYLKTDIPTEISWWLKVMRDADKERLYLGGHSWGTGKFIVVSVHPNNARYLGDGTLLSCDLELKFVEWVAEGSADADSSTATTAATDTSTKSTSSSSTTIKAKSIKNTEKSVSKSAKATKATRSTSTSSRAKVSKTVNITYRAMQNSGTLTISWKAPDGHTASRALRSNAVIAVVLGSIVTLTWKASKANYLLKVSVYDPQTKTHNEGKLKFLASVDTTIKAYWK